MRSAATSCDDPKISPFVRACGYAQKAMESQLRRGARDEGGSKVLLEKARWGRALVRQVPLTKKHPRKNALRVFEICSGNAQHAEWTLQHGENVVLP